eukprot:TRINITY_DN1551_c0_g3_i1.p1 TRINITY_DN1551_c0_g3~~TRINITY_DN1551_c0_g3_i1.p1  ORF type:complete len:353 (-),score=-34.14 TRINITY_DN1551_c0_g3_i1:57-1115(-)
MFTWLKLPHEIWLAIATVGLDVATVARVARTCQELHGLMMDDSVWQNFVPNCNKTGEHWYEICKRVLVVPKGEWERLPDLPYTEIPENAYDLEKFWGLEKEFDIVDGAIRKIGEIGGQRYWRRLIVGETETTIGAILHGDKAIVLHHNAADPEGNLRTTVMRFLDGPYRDLWLLGCNGRFAFDLEITHEHRIQLKIRSTISADQDRVFASDVLDFAHPQVVRTWISAWKDRIFAAIQCDRDMLLFSVDADGKNQCIRNLGLGPPDGTRNYTRMIDRYDGKLVIVTPSNGINIMTYVELGDGMWSKSEKRWTQLGFMANFEMHLTTSPDNDVLLANRWAYEYDQSPCIVHRLC